MAIQFPLFPKTPVNKRWHLTGCGLTFTFRIPVLTATPAPFQERSRWRSHKRNHLDQMLLIVEMTVFHGAKQTTTFEKIPDLPSVSINRSRRDSKSHTMTPTDHMSILESHSMPMIIPGAR